MKEHPTDAEKLNIPGLGVKCRYMVVCCVTGDFTMIDIILKEFTFLLSCFNPE